MPKQKILLLGFLFNNPNFGIQALLNGTIRSIEHNYVSPNIYILTYSKGPLTKNVILKYENKEISACLINMRFSYKFWLSNNIFTVLFCLFFFKFFPLSIFHKSLRNHLKAIPLIEQCDLIFSISGGDSFSDIYGFKRYLFVSLPQLLPILLGKKICQLPQTYGPFGSVATKMITKHIFNHSTIIHCRERISYNYICTVFKDDIMNKLTISHDVGFLLEPHKPLNGSLSVIEQKKALGFNIIGFNISGLLFRGIDNFSTDFKFLTDYQVIIRYLADIILMDNNNILLLIPHVKHDKTNSENDISACLKFFERYYLENDRVFIADGPLDANQTKYVIGLVDLFIGSRMHSCIGALSQSVPTIALAYSDKFMGVFSMLNMSRCVIDPRHMSLEQITDLYQNISITLDSIKDDLSAILPEVFKSAIEVTAKTN